MLRRLQAEEMTLGGKDATGGGTLMPRGMTDETGGGVQPGSVIVTVVVTLVVLLWL